MGKRGPAPRPTSLKVLAGTRRDRINMNEPIPAEQPIHPPEAMSPAALEIWSELAPDLIRTKTLTTWDVPAFEMLCETLASWQRARADVAGRGEVIIEQRLKYKQTVEVEVPNPNWKILREAADLTLRLAARFGLTPADRSQLSIDPDPARGEDDEIIAALIGS